VLHPEDKAREAEKPSFESPTGLDLHPLSESSPRISKRVGLIIGVLAVLVLIGFAYGGYRRSAKAQAAANGHSRPKMLAPAADADIVKGIPTGNAAITRMPTVQSSELQPPNDGPAVSGSNPCFAAGKPAAVYRFILKQANRVQRLSTGWLSEEHQPKLRIRQQPLRCTNLHLKSGHWQSRRNRSTPR
jgi:hypothetical protein